jgi:hypothetical protein
VILVPGYGGDDAMLATLATRLDHAGRSTIVLALPDGATGDPAYKPMYWRPG